MIIYLIVVRTNKNDWTQPTIIHGLWLKLDNTRLQQNVFQLIGFFVLYEYSFYLAIEVT